MPTFTDLADELVEKLNTLKFDRDSTQREQKVEFVAKWLAQKFKNPPKKTNLPGDWEYPPDYARR